MFKVQTLNSIATQGLDQFSRDLYEVASDISDPDAILVRSFNMHAMSIPSSVKVIGRAGVGLNNIPVEQLTKRGIPVFNTPGANANAVRELVIAGMLLASRNICQAWQYVVKLQSEGSELEASVEQAKKQFVGFELQGKKLGIIGLGNVGVKVANAALHLGMDVVGYDPAITVQNAWELSSSVRQAHSIDEVLMQADFVSFHVPLIEATKHLINSSRLPLMKAGAVLVNFSREAIVDNEALLHALNNNKISAYVTDFPVSLLKGHPRVISLPHLGASTKEAEENCAFMVARQVRAFLETGSIYNAVNFPTLQLGEQLHHPRLAIVNANVPNMVAQVSAKLAEAGLNIVSLSNQSRNEIAYTIIDLAQEINEKIMQQIAAIEGVMQLRTLNPRRQTT